MTTGTVPPLSPTTRTVMEDALVLADLLARLDFLRTQHPDMERYRQMIRESLENTIVTIANRNGALR